MTRTGGPTLPSSSEILSPRCHHLVINPLNVPQLCTGDDQPSPRAVIGNAVFDANEAVFAGFLSCRQRPGCVGGSKGVNKDPQSPTLRLALSAALARLSTVEKNAALWPENRP